MTNATAVAQPSDTAAADPRRWKALAVLSLMQFMLVLDITVVNVALPHIKTDLGFSTAGLAWVVDAYVLMAGGLLLLGGRLADFLGRRRVFVAGISLFGLASILSGAATSPGLLIASRFLQGAGEAMAAPAGMGLVALLFRDPKERAKAIGLSGGVAGLGGTLGPVISGLILGVVSWRWIFFINVPVALFTVVAVPRLVPESRASEAGRSRPDVAGAVLATAGLVAVVYGLIQAATHSWGSGQVLVPLVGGVVVLGLFVLRQATARQPLVPLRFFANRTRVGSNLVTLLFATVFFSVYFLLTLFLQDVEHYSALRTGLSYLPMGVAISLGIGIAAKAVPRFGVKAVLGTGFALNAAGLALLGRLSAHASYAGTILPGMLVLSVGCGLCFAGFGNASVHGVSEEDASLASGVQSAVQQVGGAVGLAVLATLALRHAGTAMHHGVSAGAASASGTVLAYRIGAGILVAGVIAVCALFERSRPAVPEAVTLSPASAITAS
jgi:EmrB/QacA subfamily drug resistance transporter